MTGDHTVLRVIKLYPFIRRGHCLSLLRVQPVHILVRLPPATFDWLQIPVNPMEQAFPHKTNAPEGIQALGATIAYTYSSAESNAIWLAGETILDASCNV